MAECRHGLDERSCVPCSGMGAGPPDTIYGRLFEAKYPGRCRGECQGQIDELDMIRSRVVDGEPDGYVHAECT